MINRDLILDVKQGSHEWLQARAGLISASNFSKIITSTGKKSTSATAYLWEVVNGRITGEAEATYKSSSMERGNELEGAARDYYDMFHSTNKKVEEVGLIYLDGNKTISASPDGLVNDDKGLEIKCPMGATHCKYLMDNKLPAAYIQQVQGSMWVTGASRWGFMSFHPAHDRQLFLTVERDDYFIELLSEAVLEFDKKVNETINKIKGKNLW